VCQNLVPLVNIKIAGKWMFIPLKMVLIGIDPYPFKKKTSVALLRLHDCGSLSVDTNETGNARRFTLTFNCPLEAMTAEGLYN